MKLLEMKQLPEILYHLFWDINLENFNPLEYPEYTISRILEFGDRDEINWMRNIFSESQIKDVVRSDKKLSPKSANFWAIIFKIPSDEVFVLKNSGKKIL